MRFAKVMRFLFTLALTLGVFSGELVEISRLVDDVSNDFVQVSATPIHKCAQIAPGRLSSHKSISLAEDVVPGPAFIPSIKPSLSSAPDLLRLLSIQRK